MNDARIWQREMNQTRQEEIARHLVGDSLRFGRQPPDRLQIVGTKALQALAGHCWNRLGHGTSAGTADLLGESRHLAKLASAENLRVALENLLDERRARARHANDKNRHGRRIAMPLLLVH